MLITRCAWHRGYHGHPALIGITDWRGLRLGFRDGICSQCAAQLRADVPGWAPTEPSGRADVVGWMPGIGLVTVAAMAMVLLVAQPVHEPPEAQRITAAIDPGDESRTVDQQRAGIIAAPRSTGGAAPRTVGVAPPRAGDTRLSSSATRQPAPRGAGPSRPRASSHTGFAARGPSQAP